MTPSQRKRSPRRTQKPKLLLDEGLPPRTHFPRLNQYFNVKHVKHNYKFSGESDKTIYRLACQEGRILIVFNIKHFKPLITNAGVSVVGVSTNLSNQQIDRKLISFLKKLKPALYKGRQFSITGETGGPPPHNPTLFE